MPSDDYAPIGGGGALKLKGAKVSKKKKKSKEKADLAKNLADGEGTVAKTKSPATNDNDDGEAEKRSEGEDDAMLGSRKTEAEKRYEEVKRKRVGFHCRHCITVLDVVLTRGIVITNGRIIWLPAWAAEDAQGACRRVEHISLKTE